MEKYIPCIKMKRKLWEQYSYQTKQTKNKKKSTHKKKGYTKDKECHSIMIKGQIQEEDIPFINMYAPNIGAPKDIQQKLRDIKGVIDSNVITAEDCISHLHQWIDHPNRKSIRKHWF